MYQASASPSPNCSVSALPCTGEPLSSQQNQRAQSRAHTTTQLQTTTADSRMKMNGGVLLVQYLLVVLCTSVSVGEPLTTLCFHIIPTHNNTCTPEDVLRNLSVTLLQRVLAGSSLHQRCAYVACLTACLVHSSVYIILCLLCV